MFGVIRCGSIQHVKRTLIVDDTGIADGQTFPRLRGIRRKSRIAGMFFEFHDVKDFNAI